MTISEKIAARSARREKLLARIAADREAVGQLNREIDTLQALEIKALLHEVDIPFDQVKKVIRDLSVKPKEDNREEKA